MVWDLILGFFLSFMPAPDAASFPAPIVDSLSVTAFSPHHAPFHVRFGDQPVTHRVMAMFVLPGETVPVEVAGAGTPSYRLAAAGGAVPRGPNAWSWTAPSRAGVYPIEIRERGGRTVTIHAFVMVPNSVVRNGWLNGYPIGRYPAARGGHGSAYTPPAGFVEVTPELERVAVSPHFTLGQFVCKQEGSPRYLVLQTDLLVKLEAMLAALNERGVRAGTFALLSAYRTPFYNAAIGNETGYSRHHYGDAADIFVDEDGDGRMDDLNGDGRHTIADARVLQAIADELDRSAEFGALAGGLGAYAPNHAHGAFVHVDARGDHARWGS